MYVRVRDNTRYALTLQVSLSDPPSYLHQKNITYDYEQKFLFCYIYLAKTKKKSNLKSNIKM